MTWKLTLAAQEMEPLPGVPWRDMTDDEFREAAEGLCRGEWLPATIATRLRLL
jgi:hypothetical protein